MTDLFQKLQRLLSKIRYGNVTLVIHDSKVVRIEAVEKIRVGSTPMELSKEPFSDERQGDAGASEPGLQLQ